MTLEGISNDLVGVAALAHSLQRASASRSATHPALCRTPRSPRWPPPSRRRSTTAALRERNANPGKGLCSQSDAGTPTGELGRGGHNYSSGDCWSRGLRSHTAARGCLAGLRPGGWHVPSGPSAARPTQRRARTAPAHALGLCGYRRKNKRGK